VKSTTDRSSVTGLASPAKATRLTRPIRYRERRSAGVRIPPESASIRARSRASSGDTMRAASASRSIRRGIFDPRRSHSPGWVQSQSEACGNASTKARTSIRISGVSSSQVASQTARIPSSVRRREQSS
jgi:hypothetical protein